MADELTACKNCKWTWGIVFGRECVHGHELADRFDPVEGVWKKVLTGLEENENYHNPMAEGYNTDGHCPHYKYDPERAAMVELADS